MKVPSLKPQVSPKGVLRTSFKFFLPIAYCLLPICFLHAQQKNLPLNREQNLDFDRLNNFISNYENESDTIKINRAAESGIFGVKVNNPSCFKPYIAALISDKKDTSKSLFIRKLKKESLLIVNDTIGKFHLTIDPLFNFEYGKDFADSSKSFYKNTRGFLIRGDIGKNFSFESSFLENQATFPKYISDFNDTFFVVPGQGRWKRFKKDGYDFAMASGYISYSPNQHFNFQLGHGKHFTGDGYRSLLLSDNTFNYPFLRITSSFGKFQYTNLYTSFINLTDGGVKTPGGTERLFQKKAGSFQFLSWSVHKRIQLGFFQGMIWKSADSSNKIYLNASYFNPFILVNSFEQGMNNVNNVLLGSALKLKITNFISLYGQYMLDDIAKDFSKGSIHNKQGFQVGAKYFDLFGAKNLHLQLEYNRVRPYSYAHENSSQSYTHYNQPLAHPLGANFKETILFLNYSIGDFFTEVKIIYAITGKDSAGRNYGNNIFKSDSNAFYGINSSGNETGQGVKTTLRIFDFHVGYLVNPSTNLNVLVGISNRSSTSAIENSQTNFIYIGIRTSLSNVYYDF